MDQDSLFDRLRDDLAPNRDVHSRVRASMKRRIDGPAMLRLAKEQIQPTRQQHLSVWRRIFSRIDSPVIASLFDRIRNFLSPEQTTQQRVKMALFERLAPVAVMPLHRRSSRFIAAFVVVMLALRISPLLFLAPATIAESSVLLIPTNGTVELSLDNLWQPVSGQIALNKEVTLRTEDGEATILLHDNGNVRLAPHTTVTLLDVSDHSTPGIPEPTLSLQSGKIWLQGLLPDTVRGFTVTTADGDVTVQGGSVLVEKNAGTTVQVWDRDVAVDSSGKSFAVIAGDTVTLTADGPSRIEKMATDADKDSWVAQNLDRDSVHQREMAQMQEERHAAQAGILPNSPLYPVKRVAEAVDVLLTLDPQAKVQKQLAQANTRLNEAAALLAAGDSGASIPLNEYKQTLIAVATGSGDSAATKSLIQQAVVQNTAQLSAALPDDMSYLLKKTVLEASAQLPDSIVNPGDVSGTLLVDTLDALHQAVQSGSGTQVKQVLGALTPYLPALQGTGSSLKPDVKQEALSIISDVTQAVQSDPSSGSGSVGHEVVQTLAAYLPEQATEPASPSRVTVDAAAMPSLSEAELDAAVQASLRRIFTVFRMPQSQENQLRVEVQKFANSPDEGRYLRRLYNDLPEQSTLQQFVRHAIQQLREQQILQGVSGQTGSGGAM